MTDPPKPQLDKFKELARDLEADEDETLCPVVPQ